MDWVRASREQLEARFEGAPLAGLPRGTYWGRHLCWIPNRHPPPRWLRPALTFGFRWMPFGIDFDDRSWFFAGRRLRTGRFRLEVGQSRWRNAEVLRLYYDVSRLPRAVRAMLYDEVKPIDEHHCLGIGGINAPEGQGEQFFFVLRRAKS